MRGRGVIEFFDGLGDFDGAWRAGLARLFPEHGFGEWGWLCGCCGLSRGDDDGGYDLGDGLRLVFVEGAPFGDEFFVRGASEFFGVGGFVVGFVGVDPGLLFLLLLGFVLLGVVPGFLLVSLEGWLFVADGVPFFLGGLNLGSEVVFWRVVGEVTFVRSVGYVGVLGRGFVKCMGLVLLRIEREIGLAEVGLGASPEFAGADGFGVIHGG